jgi:hypothetical protein
VKPRHNYNCGYISCRIHSALVDVLDVSILAELNNFASAKSSRQQSVVDITKVIEKAKNKEPAS